MPGPEGGICGKACAGTTSLKGHVREMHDTPAAGEGISGNIGSKKIAELRSKSGLTVL